jgi:Fic family protein
MSGGKRPSLSIRAGRYVSQPGGFKAFVPSPLPPPDLNLDPALLALSSDAELAVGRLDGAAAVIPDPGLFVFQYVRREAVLSSQIEGTQASLMDVLEFEALAAEAERQIDVAEIVNYIAAMNHGISRLQDLPISRRLLCEVHEVLMRDVRGGEPQKTPGEFRRSQNWIGGGSPASAVFVPPPADHLDQSFAELERFIHDTQPFPPLMKAGLVHAQFEAIHPFLDGNGRVGRLLITFQLVAEGVIRRPLLYPSLYFKEHQNEYIDRLQAIRDKGAWEQWLAFFLDGVNQVATEATETATRIIELRERDRDLIARKMGRRTGRAHTALDLLFRQPVVSAKTVENALGVSQPTASALVSALGDLGILTEITGRRRNRLFAYQEYLDLFPEATSRG